MKIRIIQLFCLFVFWINVQASAQIGYQVSLLNSATGEPRVHATVNAQVTLTNSLDEIILTENKSVTSNDFGVLSFTIGDENTLKDVDWNKLPFYISVKVDGVLIGKSQVLSVPVAEYAKQAGPIVTKEMLMREKWIRTPDSDPNRYSIYIFTENEFAHEYSKGKDAEGEVVVEYEYGSYDIINRRVYCFDSINSVQIFEYIPSKNMLIDTSYQYNNIFYAESLLLTKNKP